MRTITFYSYKGGVGRSLLVANTAKYLSTLGKSVVALDFDLEAPGLHYKFSLGADNASESVSVGVLDILADFLNTGELPATLHNYITEVPVAATAGPIRVMRAGVAPLGDYWRTLSRINWYDLFYGDDPLGIPFFLELRERISQEFAPDFCLIDARTGITDMGGVATTLLPDTVVCLALDSREHLEGLRAMMQGVQQTAKHHGLDVTLVPVISRLLLRKERSIEHERLERIRLFLNDPVRAEAPSLNISEVVTLHAEPLLASEEQLLVGGANSPHDLPLLRDYLKLCSKIIPAEDIRPYVGQLIQKAVGSLLDDPDGAQSDLEALTTYCADQEAYRALLKLYQVRKAPFEKVITTAATMWQLSASNPTPEPLLVDIIRQGYSESRTGEIQKKYVDFAEDVWRASGMDDERIGLAIANAHMPERRSRAVRLLSDYVSKEEAPSSSVIVTLLDFLRDGSSYAAALSLVDQFKSSTDMPAFHIAWARVAVDQDDSASAKSVLGDPSFRPNAVRIQDPMTFYRLLRLARADESASFLREALETAVAAENLGQLQDLAEIYHEEGEFEEFLMRTEGRVPRPFLNDVRQTIQKRRRRYRMLQQEYIRFKPS